MVYIQCMHANDSDKAHPTDDTVCGECGASLIPLKSVHTVRPCEKCGKTTYVFEPGENGQGIRLRTGDRLVFPPGTISMGLDRSSSSGWFTRAGLGWFASMLFVAGAPEKPDDLSSLFDHYLEECEAILRRSDALNDLDLDSEADAQIAVERIRDSGELRDSIEYWAFALIAALADPKSALNQGDAQHVAWAMNRLTNSHAMLVFKRDLEDIAWRGYLTESLRDMLRIWHGNQNNDDEELWQRTFADHPLILSQAFAVPIVILKSKAYVGGKGIENSQGKVTDFLVANRVSGNAALIEIKTPKTRLVGASYRAGVYSVSSELSGAVVQVSAQRDSFLKDYHQLSHNSDIQFSAFSPHGLVIAGNLQEGLTDANRRQSFELFRQGLHDVQIVTFDELFGKIENLLHSLQGE